MRPSPVISYNSPNQVLLTRCQTQTQHCHRGPHTALANQRPGSGQSDQTEAHTIWEVSSGQRENQVWTKTDPDPNTSLCLSRGETSHVTTGKPSTPHSVLISIFCDILQCVTIFCQVSVVMPSWPGLDCRCFIPEPGPSIGSIFQIQFMQRPNFTESSMEHE